MIFDERREQQQVTPYPQPRSYTGAFVAISLLVAFLFVVDLYTLDRLNSARCAQENMRTALAKEMKDLKSQDEQLTAKFSLLEQAQSGQIDALRRELDTAAGSLGSSTGQVLDRARAMVTALKQDQQRLAGDLKQELSQKADADDLGALSENVTAAEAQLGTTRRTVDVLTKDLGAARSELGSAVASSSDAIRSLRENSDRDYHEIALARNQVSHVLGISLVLRKTDVRANRFSLDVIANDQLIRNKNRNIDEPIYFYVGDLKSPYELVVNEVDDNGVKGYIIAPKAVIAEEAPGSAS